MQRSSGLIGLLHRLRTSMTKGPKFAVFAVVLASLPLTGVSRPGPKSVRALCCLCMCHSVDENQCAKVCVNMQHSSKIVEEPEMKACTKSCLRYGIQQIFFSEDGTRFVVTPGLTR